MGIVSSKEVTTDSIPHPIIPNERVHVLADVSHLVKYLRNHLVNGQDIVPTKNIVGRFDLPNSLVTGEPLKKLVNYQKDNLKPAPNLTEKHLQLSHFDKMKVSTALNVFSHSVSSSLKLMVNSLNWSKSVLTTAWFLETISHFFDLMSSRHPTLALSKFDSDKYSESVKFLQMVKELFQNITIGKEG